MDIAQRIQMVIHNNQLTNAAFADIIGVQRSNISHVISGRSKPSMDFLSKVLLNFPRVNAHWLMTGQQSPNRAVIKDEVKEEEEASASIKKNSSIKEPSLTKEKPDVQASHTKPSEEIAYILMVMKDGTFKKIIPQEQGLSA